MVPAVRMAQLPGFVFGDDDVGGSTLVSNDVLD
jgi:hypothetical protein